VAPTLVADTESLLVRGVIDAGVYMRGLVKAVRDSELALLKKMGRMKGPPPFDPKRPRAVRVYGSCAITE